MTGSIVAEGVARFFVALPGSLTERLSRAGEVIDAVTASSFSFPDLRRFLKIKHTDEVK